MIKTFIKWFNRPLIKEEIVNPFPRFGAGPKADPEMVVVDKLIKSLEESPDDWVLGSMILKNKKNQVSLWLGTDKKFLSFYDPSAELNKAQRDRLWPAIEEFQAYALIKRLEGL